MRKQGMSRHVGFAVAMACLMVLPLAQMRPQALAAEVPGAGQSRTIDAIKARGTIRVGVNVALPWLGQNPTTSEFFGPAMEIGNAIAKTLGVTLTLSTAASDVIIAGLQANQYDLALAPLFATPKRMEVVDFVNWTSAGQCYAVLKDSKIDTLEDLDNPSVTIGTWSGTGADQAIKAKYLKAKYNSVVMAVGGSNRMEEVLAKRIDVATLDSARANLVAHQFPQLKIIPGGPESCIKNPDVPTPIGMAFAKGDPALQKFLTQLVEEMRPQIEQSLAKYSSIEMMLPH
jgi:ABC-type amino acid transport substrate-binding protein